MIYTSNQKTRHQKLLGYEYPRGQPVHTVELSNQVIKIEYMYICIDYTDTSCSRGQRRAQHETVPLALTEPQMEPEPRY